MCTGLKQSLGPISLVAVLLFVLFYAVGSGPVPWVRSIRPQVHLVGSGLGPHWSSGKALALMLPLRLRKARALLDAHLCSL